MGGQEHHRSGTDIVLAGGLCGISTGAETEFGFAEKNTKRYGVEN